MLSRQRLAESWRPFPFLLLDPWWQDSVLKRDYAKHELNRSFGEKNARCRAKPAGLFARCLPLVLNKCSTFPLTPPTVLEASRDYCAALELAADVGIPLEEIPSVYSALPHLLRIVSLSLLCSFCTRLFHTSCLEHLYQAPLPSLFLESLCVTQGCNKLGRRSRCQMEIVETSQCSCASS